MNVIKEWLHFYEEKTNFEMDWWCHNFLSFWILGRLYLYLGQREYISCDGVIEDIKGVAYMPDLEDNIKGKAIIKRNVQYKANNLVNL